MKNTLKVLLIGAKGYDCTSNTYQLFCVEWERINTIGNIKDYDVLLLNLYSSSDQNTIIINSKDVLKKLSSLNCKAVIQNNGCIYILGDPRLNLTFFDTEIPFLDWTGLRFYWDSEGGNTIEYDDTSIAEVKEYCGFLKKWSYSLNNLEICNSISNPYLSNDKQTKHKKELLINKESLCWNRYKQDLLFCLHYQIFDHATGRSEDFGPITFLPQISLNEDETIKLVLKNFIGIETLLPEPEWLLGHKAPGESIVNDKIDSIKSKIQTEQKKLENAEKERMNVRKFLKLLYESDYALEPIVRDTLRNLGAHVVDPIETNKEDGWLKFIIGDKVFEGVLEIKSTRSDTFNDLGRKQLLDWIDRGRTKENKNFKGIFIGNSAIDKPVNERPSAFSDDWVKAAKLSSICAIKTEDLYFLYQLHYNDQLDIDSFWSDLFLTDGIFDIEKYRKQLDLEGI